MTLDLRYYLAVFLRRFHIFVLVFGAVTAAALTAAFTLPPVYYTEAKLLVEASQIPEQLAASTVNTAAQEQLQIIEQRLMTRSNLLDIARRLNVYENIEELTADEIVQAMRANSRISSRGGRGQATRMNVGFEAGSAEVAAAVVNEYVTLILRDNVALRTDRAQDTLEFFQQEVERLSGEVSAQSAKILEFQNANADALPDTLDFRLKQQDTLQQRLIAIEESIDTLTDQKQQLIRLYNATGQVQNTPGNTLSPEARQLINLKDQLNSALAIYSPEHPNVKLLQAQVDQLEAVVAAQKPDPASTEEPEEVSLLKIQTDQIDRRIAQQNRQRDLINEELIQLASSIERTSANTITLDALNRDYKNIQDQYNVAVDRLAKASTGERIEVMAKGERITVTDAAPVPSAPTKPNRKKIAAAGIVAGFGLGIGLIMLLEMLNGAVRRPSDLVRQLEISPIGAIPYMRNRGEIIRRRLALSAVMLVVILGLPGAIWAVHTYYMPLDLVLAKVADKVGI